VSKIHEALQDTNAPAGKQNSRSFNPLASQTNSRSAIGYYTAVLIVLAIAVLIVLWPSVVIQQPTEQLTSEQPGAIAETEPSAKPEIRPAPLGNSVTRAQPKTIAEAEAAPESTPIPETAPKQVALAPALTPENKADTEPTAAIEKSTSDIDSQTAVTAAKQSEVIEPEVIEPEVIEPEVIEPEVIEPEPMELKASKSKSTESGTLTTAVASNSQVIENGAVVRTSQAKWQNDVQNQIRNGNIEQAEANLKQWIRTIPDDPTPRIWLARIYINNGFYEAAEPILSGLKGHSDADALLGIIYEKTQRPELAAHTFELLYRNNPNNNRWLLFWAVNAENSRELVIAQTLYQNYLNRFATSDAGLTQFAQSRLRVLGGAK
jgi:hypothetical protein